MFRRELKINFKSFCIWTFITISLYFVVFLVYPSISNGTEIESLNQMMKIFPEDILKAFNMDISSIDNVYGWLKSEGFVFILLIIGCYSGILGSNILLKEENDKTIEYLAVLPMKRINIILSKSLVGIIYIICLTLVIGTFNFLGLKLSVDFNTKQYILLSLTPLISSFLIFFICMFLSTFTNKTKKMLGVSLALILVSYVLNVLSSLSKNIEFLKYFSVFTLSDIRNVILNVSINIRMVVISLIGSMLFLILSIIKYNKKELV
ncbi:MAG: ABC transporter permease subunit [bacterium]|nr:ABC transporter permease subunit [bacterium]